MKASKYREARAKGVCPQCGKPVEPGKVYCPECAEVVSWRQHIHYIRRKYGCGWDAAVKIFEGGEVQRFVRDGHIPQNEAAKKAVENAKPTPKPKQSIDDIHRLAEEASAAEHRYVSYGEMSARQSGAYNWKISINRV